MQTERLLTAVLAASAEGSESCLNSTQTLAKNSFAPGFTSLASQRTSGEGCGGEAFVAEKALPTKIPVFLIMVKNVYARKETKRRNRLANVWQLPLLLSLLSGNAFAQNAQLKATLTKAAKGDAQAQFQLGGIYEFGGEEVVADPAKAAKWYRKAAEHGLPRAQYNLARLYADGQGVPQDYRQAFHWLRKAAAQNYVLAWNRLGVMCERGKGVAHDDVEACKWFSLAANQQNIAAVVNLEKLSARLTEAQLAEGRRRAEAETSRTSEVSVSR